MKRSDILISLVIGEISALLMIAISRNLELPASVIRVIPWLPIAFPVFTLAVMVVGSLFSRAVPLFYQLAKFALVGGQNFLIDLGVLNLLIAATGITAGFYAVAFKAAAFLVAVSASFVFNKFWTFQSRSTEAAGHEFTGFFAVSAVGLLVNAGAFALINDALGSQAGIEPKTWASVAALGAAVAGLLWNFIGYKLIVFRKTSG